MIKEFLEIGQIVSTHGIKGEVRLNPWCDSPEFVKKFKTLYRDEKGNNSSKIVSCRPHGNVAVLKIEGVDTVEDAQKLRNTILYMKRSDINLPEGKWFVSELIGCSVLDYDDNNICYGKIKDIESYTANDVWYIETPDGKEVLIPAIKDVVIKCDPKEFMYISTKPIHPSQRIIPDKPNHIKLKVQENYELYQWLLFYGDKIEVVSPQSVRNKFRSVLQRMVSKYNDK